MKFSWIRPDKHEPQDQGGDASVKVSLDSLVGLRGSAAGLDLGNLWVARARQAGGYLSRVKGRGMEFDEARLYQPGDDVRNIDWRVTARTGRSHTKLFREERERPVFISVDYRTSMFFATRGVFKSVLAAQFAGLLAWSAVHHGDRVGGQVFSERYHEDFKPRSGSSAVLHLLNYLAVPAAKNRPSPDNAESSLQGAMARLARLARPGSLVFLISDFRKLNSAAESHLLRLSRHCEVVLIGVNDAIERELPPGGRYCLGDGEREMLLNTSQASTVERYHERFLRHQDHLQHLARRPAITLLLCDTRDNPREVLRQGLKSYSRSA